MDLWSFYFFAKLFLYGGQYIDFHLWPNLAFALALSLPIRQRQLRLLRSFAAWCLVTPARGAKKNASRDAALMAWSPLPAPA